MLKEEIAATATRSAALIGVPTAVGDGWLEVALSALVIAIAEVIHFFTGKRKTTKSED